MDRCCWDSIPWPWGLKPRLLLTWPPRQVCLLSFHPYSYAYFTSKDLPWLLTLEALSLLFPLRSPTLELCIPVCLFPQSFPLLPSNRRLPYRFLTVCSRWLGGKIWIESLFLIGSGLDVRDLDPGFWFFVLTSRSCSDLCPVVDVLLINFIN